MDDKPKFRDFYWGYNTKRKEDIFYINDKKERKVTAYKKLPLNERRKYDLALLIPLALILAGLFIILILTINKTILWMGIYWDAFFGYLLLSNIIMILSRKRLYSVMPFEKADDSQIDDKKMRKYIDRAEHNHVFTYINIGLWFLLCLMNSYSLNYIHYLCDGGSGNNTGKASVYISLPHNYHLTFSNTSSDQDFIALSDVDILKPYKIYIDTYNTPEKVKLYINGKETGYNAGNDTDVYASNYFFWSDDYFQISINGSIYFKDAFQGVNTLELKSSCFYKKWTFTFIKK